VGHDRHDDRPFVAMSVGPGVVGVMAIIARARDCDRDGRPTWADVSVGTIIGRPRPRIGGLGMR